MYIDTHDHRPVPAPHGPRRPNLRPLVPIAIAVVLLVVSALVPPLPAFGLILAAGALIARTVAKLIPSVNGLEDYRQ
jgi:predicted exporter